MHHQQGTHIIILNNYTISTSELYIIALPGWHDYRPALNSLNRPRFHCWADSQSDWLRSVLLKLDILQGRQRRQWKSVDETACAEFSGGAAKSQPFKGIQQVFDIHQNPMPLGVFKRLTPSHVTVIGNSCLNIVPKQETSDFLWHTMTKN